jgi:hypothetical protein
MIPMIRTASKNQKNRGALKKLRKMLALAALVDAQLNIDKQHSIHLITSPVTANK